MNEKEILQCVEEAKGLWEKHSELKRQYEPMKAEADALLVKWNQCRGRLDLECRPQGKEASGLDEVAVAFI